MQLSPVQFPLLLFKDISTLHKLACIFFFKMLEGVFFFPKGDILHTILLCKIFLLLIPDYSCYSPASSQVHWEISTISKIKNSIVMLLQRRKTSLNMKHRIPLILWSMKKNCPFRCSRYCHQISPKFQMKLIQTSFTSKD